MLSVSNYNYLSEFYKKSFKKTIEKKHHKKINLITEHKKLKDLNNNGFCVLKDVFSKNFIDEINSDFQKHIKSLKHISLPRDLRFKLKNKKLKI